MSADEHSFRKLLPGFVIPAGTQVVLKAAKVLPGGERFKPSGSVGIVLECPPDKQHPYLVRFNEHFRFKFLDELIARKVGGENIGVGDLDWPFHEAKLTELEAALDQAFQESKLPEDRDRKPVNDLLVRLRLGQQ